METLIDEIIDIADDASQDINITEKGKEICNSEFIARSRLRIDTRKWLASKLAPKIYGQNPVTLEISPPSVKTSLKGVTDPNEAARVYAQIMRAP